MIAKGYLTKLLEIEAVKALVDKYESKILSHFKLVVNVVSIEDKLNGNFGELAKSEKWGSKPEISRG